MAIKMALFGGLGIIHCNNTVEGPRCAPIPHRCGGGRCPRRRDRGLPCSLYGTDDSRGAEQCEEVKRVKRFENGFILDPFTVSPTATLTELDEIKFKCASTAPLASPDIPIDRHRQLPRRTSGCERVGVRCILPAASSSAMPPLACLPVP